MCELTSHVQTFVYFSFITPEKCMTVNRNGIPGLLDIFKIATLLLGEQF